MTDDFLPMIRSICAQLGIETPLVTDAFGRPTVAIDRAGMEKIRDTARATGFPELADGIDQLLGRGPSMREQHGRIVPVTGGDQPC